MKAHHVQTAMREATAAMMGKGVRIPPPKPRSLTARLYDDVLDGLRVFNALDGLGIAEELLQARARNIVAGLIGNYRFEDPNDQTRRSR